MRSELQMHDLRCQAASACAILAMALTLGCVMHDTISFQSDDFEVEVGSARRSDEGIVLDRIEGRARGARNLVGFECYVFDDRNADQRVQEDEVLRRYQYAGPPSQRMQLHQIHLRDPGEHGGQVALTMVGHFDRGDEVRVFLTAHEWSE
jgi:hypothetical protein